MAEKQPFDRETPQKHKIKSLAKFFVEKFTTVTLPFFKKNTILQHTIHSTFQKLSSN
jgi:hypothetical protein